ncbi:hypothetical protein J6590_093831, partial [Homalodisca vitripennis]
LYYMVYGLLWPPSQPLLYGGGAAIATVTVTASIVRWRSCYGHCHSNSFYCKVDKMPLPLLQSHPLSYDGQLQ